jgi:3-deoxy-manno-octulosonate cytidylyltransferase (CMP-KDO synthetase)
MKIIGVIPSRYASTRFEGKPLALIAGYPMIYWVYQSVKKAHGLDKIYVATDDMRIFNVCKEYGFDVLMTKNSHPNCVYRTHEVSQKIEADRYIQIGGDEPLIEPEAISSVVEEIKKTKADFLFSYRKLSSPVETIDTGNIKVVISDNRLIYLSRIPVPCPHKSIMFDYKKIIGIQGFSKKALDFFVNTPPGEIEQIEDIAELRWIENKKTVLCKEVFSNSISVDNPRDIEKVEAIMREREGKCLR